MNDSLQTTSCLKLVYFYSHHNTVVLSTLPEQRGMPLHSALCHVLTTYPHHLHEKRNSVKP